MDDIVKSLQEKQAERALFVGKKEDIVRLLAKLAEIDEDFEGYKLIKETSDVVTAVMQNFKGTFEEALEHLSESDIYRNYLRKLSSELDCASDEISRKMNEEKGHPFIFASTQPSVPEEIVQDYSAARVFSFDDDDEIMSEWFDTTMEGENLHDNILQMGNQLNNDEFILPETQITLLSTVAKSASEVTDTSHWAIIQQSVLQVVFSDNINVSAAATNAVLSILKVAECWQVTDIIRAISPKAIKFHSDSDLPPADDVRYGHIISIVRACLNVICHHWAFIDNLNESLTDTCSLLSIPVYLKTLSEVDVYASWYESLLKSAGTRAFMLQSSNSKLLVTCSRVALCDNLDTASTQLNGLSPAARVRMMAVGCGELKGDSNFTAHCVTILSLSLSYSEGRAVFPIEMGSDIDLLNLLMFATRTNDTSLLLTDEHLAASTALHGVVLQCLRSLHFSCYSKSITSHLTSITFTAMIQQPFADMNVFLLLNFLSPLLDLSGYTFQNHSTDDVINEGNRLVVLPEAVYQHLIGCLKLLTHLTTMRQGRQLLLHVHPKGILPNQTERLLDAVIMFIERSKLFRTPNNKRRPSASLSTSSVKGKSSVLKNKFEIGTVKQKSIPASPISSEMEPVLNQSADTLKGSATDGGGGTPVTSPSHHFSKQLITDNDSKIIQLFQKEVLKLCQSMLSDTSLSSETSTAILNSDCYNWDCSNHSFSTQLDSVLEGVRCASTVQSLTKVNLYNSILVHLHKRSVVRLVTQQNRSETLCLITLSPDMLIYTSQLPDSSTACRRYTDESTPSLINSTCLSLHNQGVARWTALRLAMLCSSTWLTKPSSLNSIVTSAISGSIDCTVEVAELSALAASCAMQLDASVILLHKYEIQRKMISILTQQDCGISSASLLRHIIFTSTASIGGPSERKVDRRSSSGWHLLYVSGVWCAEPDMEGWDVQSYNCNILTNNEEAEECSDDHSIESKDVIIPNQWLSSHSTNEENSTRQSPLYQHPKDSKTWHNLNHAITQAEAAKSRDMSESNQEWLQGIREIYNHSLKVESHNGRIHSLVIKYMCTVHGLQGNSQQQGVCESHSLSGTAAMLAVKYGISLGVLDACDELHHCNLLKKHLTEIDWTAIVIYFIVGENFTFASKLPQLRYFGGITTNILKLSAAVEYVLSTPCSNYPDFPQILTMMSVGNVPLLFIVNLWTRQLFLNFLDWPHLVSTVTIVVLFGSEYLPLIIACALHHMKEAIAGHLAQYSTELATFFATTPIVDHNGVPFSVADSVDRLHVMKLFYNEGLEKTFSK